MSFMIKSYTSSLTRNGIYCRLNFVLQICNASEIWVHLYFFARPLTMKEMLEYLEEDEATTSQDIFIEPPDVHELTDEDSGDEEQPHIDNLTGNKLQACAHISNNEDQVSENVSVRREVRGRSAKKETYTWKKETNVSNAAVVFPETNHDRYKNLSPVELWVIFWWKAYNFDCSREYIILPIKKLAKFTIK